MTEGKTEGETVPVHGADCSIIISLPSFEPTGHAPP